MDQEQHFVRDLESLRRSSDARLARIENKIDQLSEAMIMLARAEEKLINMEKNNQNTNEVVQLYEKKIDSIETRISAMEAHKLLINKAIFAAFAAIITAVITNLDMFIK